MSSSIRLVVRNENGIHARPLALFVETAAAFKETKVTVRNVTMESAPKNAKSALLVVTLKIKRGHEIEVTADGPDEEAALAAIRAAVESGLGEALT